jgi:ISXO2-like transposase domain
MEQRPVPAHLSGRPGIHALVFRFGGISSGIRRIVFEWRGRCSSQTNTIEGFWAQLKRSIDGTHHSVSRKYLQNYVDEFAFRYNRRWDGEMFSSLMEGLTPAKAA